MYEALLTMHSYVRWLVLVALLLAIYRAGKGYISKATFTPTDNAVRHWAATIAHIQLLIGIILYFSSPVTKYFWANLKEAAPHKQFTFFSVIHMLLMLTAIVFITIGSAMAKRKHADQHKFKTMLIWFSLALAVVFIGIPWPFSPLANRPYFR